MTQNKNKNEKKQQYRARLGEITQVLRKYEIMRGISPKKLRLILEELGPTYIKLGQIMSNRSDILPKKYCDELMRLRSDVKPMEFADVRKVIEESYGCPLEAIFSSFEEKVLGSASIAQVHEAVLKTGERVVVKVRRMGIYEIMSRDIQLLHRAVRLVPPVSMKELVDLDMVLDEMWLVAQDEMNFLTEASNMEEFSRLNKQIAFVTCPNLYRSYTTTEVLVMEYIDGYSIDDKKSLVENGYDLTEIGRKLADHYVRQIMVDGFFHADPHPGNLRIRDGKIVWIDMGMMGRLTSRDKKLVGDVVKGVAANDTAAVMEAVLVLGIFRGNPNRGMLYKDISNLLLKYGKIDFGSIDIAKIMQDLMEVMKANKISMPHGLTMLARGLTTIEGVLVDIDPEINIVEVASTRLAEEFFYNLDWKEEIKKNSRILYETAKKTAKLPVLLEDILYSYKNGQAGINMELHATEDLAALLIELVRNLVMGFLITALLIGSSILCTTDMKPKFLGIPALGAFGYILALTLTLYIFFVHFRKKKKK